MTKSSISLIVLLFISSIAYNQEIIDKVIAVVGEKPILFSEVQSQKMQLAQQGMEISPSLDCYLLEELMLQQLLIHQAEIDSIEVTEEMVKSELDQRIQYFSAQIGGIDKLEEYYGKSVQEIRDEFYVQIEDKMKAQKMQQEIIGEILVSPKEVRSYFREIPADSIPFINSKVKVSQIILAPALSYQQKIETKNRLNKIRDRIISNEISFSVAAEFYSEDPGTKVAGGNFGWVDRGDFVPEFDALAYTIPLNTVSEVFESPYGYHILKVEKRRGEQYYGSHILIKNKIADKDLVTIKQNLDQIASEIANGKLSWDNAVTKYANKENNKSNGIVFNEATGEAYWDMQTIDKNLFFAISALEIDEISSPQYYEDPSGNIGYRIFKLMDRTSPHMANLNDDYEFIQQYALSQKQMVTMDKWVQKTAKSTYVFIDPVYQSCNNNSKWINNPW